MQSAYHVVLAPQPWIGLRVTPPVTLDTRADNDMSTKMTTDDNDALCGAALTKITYIRS